MSVTPQALVDELHAEIKRRSSVPKVAKAVGIDYSALRANLRHETSMKLSTLFAACQAIGTFDDLYEITKARLELTRPRAEELTAR